MAPPTRRPAPRNRPAPRASVQARIAADSQQTSATSSESVEDFDPQAAARELVNAFQDLLRNDHTIDAEAAQLLSEQWETAVFDASTNLKDDVAFDRAAWVEAAETLRTSGQLSAPEVEALTRQLNDALEPLEQRETQLALEFSRRIRADGQEQALAWLREQQLASLDSEPETQAIPSADASLGLPSEVIKSRSRRLRGPPRR